MWVLILKKKKTFEFCLAGWLSAGLVGCRLVDISTEWLVTHCMDCSVGWFVSGLIDYLTGSMIVLLFVF